MKWYHSIITKISLIFIVALMGISTVLFLFVGHERQRELENVESFARYTMHYSFNKITNRLNFESLNSLGLTVVHDPKLRDEVLKEKHHFDTNHIRPNIMMMRRMIGLSITAIPLERKIYIVLKQRNGQELVFATPYKKEILSTVIYPLIFLLLVILLYIAIIKNLLPLYSLRRKIKLFADGDYEVDCKSKHKDEIGILSNEFDAAVKKIKKLRNSRQLFLRNIMHELKTPIAKGKFVTELAVDENLKKALDNIFVRQETLLEEFSRIEKLNANELKINQQLYLLEDVFDFAVDILSHDISLVEKNLHPIKINVDFELFGTVLKNLLDNGINYSEDSKVSITNDEEKIVISNIGKALEFPLHTYKEPFHLAGKKQQRSRGFGFGLYITLHVIELHNMSLKYKREGNKNIFTIRFRKDSPKTPHKSA